MRPSAFVVTLVLLSPLSAQTEDAKQRDYTEFSKMIHKMVIKDLPKEIEDKSGWGQMAPLTEKLLFPRIPRVKIRVGDKEGFPDGLWKKFKVRFPEPEKNIKINVKDFSKVDAKTFRLAVDSEVVVVGDGEAQNWQKGLRLGQIDAQAGALVGLNMVFNIGVTFDTKKFPPDINIEPKMTELGIDLKEFNLRRVSNAVTGIAIEGDTAKDIGNDLKDTLKSFIKSQEPDIKNRANEAIAKSLKEGKGNISASALLKLAPAASPPQK
jgi:hypothetical protein